MDKLARQQQIDDVDAGYTAQEVLQRAAARTRAERDRALAELAVSATDQEILDLVGLDLDELRRTRPERRLVPAVTPEQAADLTP